MIITIGIFSGRVTAEHNGKIVQDKQLKSGCLIPFLFKLREGIVRGWHVQYTL
jgi:hypothetical protein